MIFHRLFIDETLPIINKSKHQKKGEYKEQNGSTHIQEDKKEPPKEGKPLGNIKFLSFLLLQKTYQIRKVQDLLKGCLP
jgi:hypothetical protein